MIFILRFASLFYIRMPRPYHWARLLYRTFINGLQTIAFSSLEDHLIREFGSVVPRSWMMKNRHPLYSPIVIPFAKWCLIGKAGFFQFILCTTKFTGLVCPCGVSLILGVSASELATKDEITRSMSSSNIAELEKRAVGKSREEVMIAQVKLFVN